LEDLSDEDMDAELDFLADADEAATKLDLARAYIDMGDAEGAKDILSEVLGEGSEEQRKEANELLGRIG
jgi:pilus assembly protein FimV